MFSNHQMAGTLLSRAGVLVAGLAMTASVGLAGAGAASAASPVLHVQDGSKWTIIIFGTPARCEVETFASNFTFAGNRGGDAGRWSGGGATIAMKWKQGRDTGLTFGGSWVPEFKEYAGHFGGTGRGKEVMTKGQGC